MDRCESTPRVFRPSRWKSKNPQRWIFMLLQKCEGSIQHSGIRISPSPKSQVQFRPYMSELWFFLTMNYARPIARRSPIWRIWTWRAWRLPGRWPDGGRRRTVARWTRRRAAPAYAPIYDLFTLTWSLVGLLVDDKRRGRLEQPSAQQGRVWTQMHQTGKRARIFRGVKHQLIATARRILIWNRDYNIP